MLDARPGCHERLHCVLCERRETFDGFTPSLAHDRAREAGWDLWPPSRVMWLCPEHTVPDAEVA